MIENEVTHRSFMTRVSLLKQLLLIGFSLTVAEVLLYRVRGGWSLEPLIWLALVWYSILMFVVELVLLRGRLGVKTLLIFVTCFALIIMFPFTEIRRADYRARFLALKDGNKTPNDPISHSPSRAELSSIWNWWAISEGVIIPKCLAWRVAKDGINDITEHGFNRRDFVGHRYPVWFINEINSFHYRITDFDLHPNAELGLTLPTQKMRPREVIFYRYGNKRFSSTRSSSEDRPNLDWVTDLVDFSNCRSLSVQGADFSIDSWNKLLAGNEIRFLYLRDTNPASVLFRDGFNRLGIEELDLCRVTDVESKNVAQLIRKSQSL